jgi:hypothetical protein
MDFVWNSSRINSIFMFIEDWERAHVLDTIYLMEEEKLLMEELMQEESGIRVIDEDNILNNDTTIDIRTFSGDNEKRLFPGFDISSKAHS